MKKIWAFLKPYRKKIYIIFLLIIFSAILNFFIPLISKNIIDKLESDFKVVVSFLLLLLGLYIMDDICMLTRENIRIKVATDFKFYLMNKAYLHINNAKLDMCNESNDMEMIQKIETDVNSIKSVIDGNIFTSIVQVFTIIGGVAGLYIIDYRLASIVIVTIPIKYCIVMMFAKKNGKLMKDYLEKQERYYEWLGDTCAGLVEIKLFGLFRYKYKEFTSKYNSLINIDLKRMKLGNSEVIVDKLFAEFLIVVIFCISGVLIWKKQITIGSVFAFLTYIAYVSNPIATVLNIKFFLAGVYPSLDRYCEFLDGPEESKDGILKVPERGNIEFRKVSFGYYEKNYIINNANFCIEYGECVGIVGKNGVGKTTILKLLLRIYEVQEGMILYGGRNISNYNINKFRNNIAIVGQEFYLFNDTIKNNICLYKNIHEKKLRNVINRSGLKELIEEKGLEYIVGCNGCLLSGGQKQKIALARVLLCDKPIIIFDEATSNIDNEMKEIFLDIIMNDLKDKIIFIIAHDEMIGRKVDITLEMEEGNIKFIRRGKDY